MTLKDIIILISKIIVIGLIVLFVFWLTPVFDNFTLLSGKQEKISYEQRQSDFIKLFDEYNKLDGIPKDYETTYTKMPPLGVASFDERGLYKQLENFFAQFISEVSKKKDMPMTIDRTIYDIYYKNNGEPVDIVFDSVLIIENKKAEITERYFLKTFVKQTTKDRVPTYEMVYVSIDFPTEEKIAAFNARTDEINKETLVIKPVYEIEIEKILTALDKLNKVEEFPQYKIEYQKYPRFTKFVLNEFFKKQFLQRANEILMKTSELNSVYLEVLRDVYDIHYKDIDKDRLYVFSLDLFNKSSSLTIPLTIFLTIPDIARFTLQDGTLATNADQLITKSDFILNRIRKRKSEEIASQIPTPLHISFEPQSKYDMTDYYTIKSKLNLLGPEFEEDYRSMKITPEMEESFKEKVTAEMIQQKLSMCFGTDGFYINKKDCEENDGLWDGPPVSNTDCPFYGKNTNYPNNFGKVVGYSCELPRNMKNFGYRSFLTEEAYQPLCYNCKTNNTGEGTLGFCCEEQKDRLKYPELTSPDYAFQGDTMERQKNRELMELNKLSVT